MRASALQSLQAKQSLLLKRVDDLDQENEELRDARAELQQTRETLEDSLYEVERQRGQLQAELSEQQVQKVVGTATGRAQRTTSTEGSENSYRWSSANNRYRR